MKRKNVQIQHYPASKISSSLIREIEKLLHDIDKNLPANHVRANHLNKPNGEFYLIRINSELVGVISYSSTWVKDKISKKKILVSFGELSYRKPRKEIKNIVSRISFMHIKRHLGPFWMFKKFIAVGISVNPRVFTQFKAFFPLTFPHLRKATPENIHTFLTKLIINHYDEPFRICQNLISDANIVFSSATDITQAYSKYYRTKDQLINSYFFEHDILKKEKQQIILTNKSVVLMGFYAPSAMIKKTLGLSPDIPELECIE